MTNGPFTFDVKSGQYLSPIKNLFVWFFVPLFFLSGCKVRDEDKGTLKLRINFSIREDENAVPAGAEVFLYTDSTAWANSERPIESGVVNYEGSVTFTDLIFEEYYYAIGLLYNSKEYTFSGQILGLQKDTMNTYPVGLEVSRGVILNIHTYYSDSGSVFPYGYVDVYDNYDNWNTYGSSIGEGQAGENGSIRFTNLSSGILYIDVYKKVGDTYWFSSFFTNGLTSGETYKMNLNVAEYMNTAETGSLRNGLENCSFCVGISSAKKKGIIAKIESK